VMARSGSPATFDIQYVIRVGGNDHDGKWGTVSETRGSVEVAVSPSVPPDERQYSRLSLASVADR